MRFLLAIDHMTDELNGCSNEKPRSPANGAVERTEITWRYAPADFFEAPYAGTAPGLSYVIDGGEVVATLSTPTFPVPEQVIDAAAAGVRAVFLARQLIVHSPFTLELARTTHYDSHGRRHTGIKVVGFSAVLQGSPADFVHRDASGAVIRDTKAERIAEEAALTKTLAAKAAQSATLLKLLDLYQRAVVDPTNELARLYDVREALLAETGCSSEKLRSHLGFSEAEWKATWGRLGNLANNEPLAEGRHPGRHTATLRPAAPAEVTEARDIVSKLIQRFAQTLP